MPNLINVDSFYGNDTAVEVVIGYVTRSGYVAGYGITSLAYAADQMKMVKRAYGKTDKRLMRHFIISFTQQESQMFLPHELLQIGAAIAYPIGLRHQIVFGVHNDTKCLHLHFGMNTVSYVDGRKISHDHSFLAEVKEYANDVLAIYGLEIKSIEWNSVAYVDWAKKRTENAKNSDEMNGQYV